VKLAIRGDGETARVRRQGWLENLRRLRKGLPARVRLEPILLVNDGNDSFIFEFESFQLEWQWSSH
jgi:hypothetical protein